MGHWKVVCKRGLVISACTSLTCSACYLGCCVIAPPHTGIAILSPGRWGTDVAWLISDSEPLNCEQECTSILPKEVFSGAYYRYKKLTNTFTFTLAFHPIWFLEYGASPVSACSLTHQSIFSHLLFLSGIWCHLVHFFISLWISTFWNSFIIIYWILNVTIKIETSFFSLKKFFISSTKLFFS